ncbi:energy transducer TonB [uncultured Prevotella sp.]|uniref:energy transducer TonB n=1 Tax=uncultured Prevotella sp. TaxID=159272 RepID=UPI00262A7A20|nr:energy transducer TonB [uncultured Prevotella sp.]
MATRGRNICNTLKAIRKQIADANGISYSPEECHFKGECKGTCPKCEQDVRDLEHELHLRQMAGKAIKVAGIAAGLVAMTACSDGKVQSLSPDATKSELNIVKKEEPKSGDRQLEGDISLRDEAKHAEEEENRKQGEIPSNPRMEITKEQTSNDRKGTTSKKSKKGNTALIQSAVDTDSIENSKIFGGVEEMPSFPGGMAALMKYIKDNLRYPEICREGAAMGRVNVVFIVNEDGSLSDVKVIRSIIPELDKEAIRVVKSMPKWNPAKQNGKAVKMKYVVSVNFRPE